MLFIILCCNEVAQVALLLLLSVLVIDIKCLEYSPRNHRILEMLGLEMISKIVESNC